jgi:hypothetical protein
MLGIHFHYCYFVGLIQEKLLQIKLSKMLIAKITSYIKSIYSQVWMFGRSLSQVDKP